MMTSAAQNGRGSPAPGLVVARAAIAAMVAVAACGASVRGVEPVPFFQAVRDQLEEQPAESAEPARDSDEGDAAQSTGDAIDRVVFEPESQRSRGGENRPAGEPKEADQEDVLVEPLTVPRPDPGLSPDIAIADYGGGRDLESSDGPLFVEDALAEEMPFPASSGKWFSSGFWYASGESLWFDRSRNKRVTVGLDTLDPRFQFTTLAQPFDTAPGVRATVGRSLGRDYLDRDRLLEFTYYGALQWQGIDGWNSLTATPSLISPLGINVPGFNLANVYRTSLDSNFNSIEVNFKLRRRLGRDKMVLSPNGGWSRHAERGFLPSLILGTRLARVDEDFWFRSRRNGVSLNDFRGDYDITTQNWVLGMNIGGELMSQNEFFYWGLRGRAAPALTFAAAQQTVIGINRTNVPANPIVPSPVFREDRNTQTSPGFIGDLTLLAGWNITPNFSLKAGYDFLWIAGIATATRQFNLDDIRENPMDAGGQIFYNGVSFGLEGSW